MSYSRHDYSTPADGVELNRLLGNLASLARLLAADRTLAELGKQAATTAALVVNNALWGDLYVTYARADEANSADVRAYLEVYLAIVESALARAAQIQSLERLAYEDPLTGLANRRALDEAAAAAFVKLGSPDMTRMTVAAFDLNGLKQSTTGSATPKATA